MKLSKLFGTALLVGTLAVVGCGDDGGGGNGGNGADPSTFCNENLCAQNDTLKNACINDVNECLRITQPGTDAENDCLAIAYLDNCGFVI